MLEKQFIWSYASCPELNSWIWYVNLGISTSFDFEKFFIDLATNVKELTQLTEVRVISTIYSDGYIFYETYLHNKIQQDTDDIRVFIMFTVPFEKEIEQMKLLMYKNLLSIPNESYSMVSPNGCILINPKVYFSLLMNTVRKGNESCFMNIL